MGADARRPEGRVLARIAATAALAIAGIVTALYAAAALLVALLRIPWDLSLPWWVRAGGVVPILGGFAMLGWLF